MDYPLPLAQHPAWVLRRVFMQGESWCSPALMAFRMGVKASRVRAFLQGNEPVTEPLARLLEAGTGMPASYWLELQEWWDEDHPIPKRLSVRIGHRAVPAGAEELET